MLNEGEETGARCVRTTGRHLGAALCSTLIAVDIPAVRPAALGLRPSVSPLR